MALSHFELYHGAVLSQVIRNPEITVKLFERSPDQGWAAYSVSDNAKDYLLYIKYTSRVTSGRRKSRCNFTFSVDDINRLKEKENKEILVCLVCGDREICLLDKKDLDELEILKHNKTCGVSVSWTKGSGLTVKSGRKELSHKVARNRLKNFPWK